MSYQPVEGPTKGTPGTGSILGGDTDNYLQGNVLDDDSILAMCKEEELLENCHVSANSSQEQSAHESPNFKFGMEGSTINITHSKDIHLGPKTISSPMNSSASSGIGNYIPEFCDSASMSSLHSLHPSPLERLRNHLSQVVKSPNKEIPLNDSKTNSNSPGTSNSIDENIIYNVKGHPSVSGEEKMSQSSYCETPTYSQGDSNMKLMFNSQCGSPSVSNLSSCADGVLHLPQEPFMSPGASHLPMSAEIKSSSHVQMGTQIVYNYYISDVEQRSVRDVNGDISESPMKKSPLHDSLQEFRNNLISVYLKRTRSSPLPWHKGKQVIPISEYYIEPQIFAIDNCGNRTSETVDLKSVLSSGNETRYLIEGEAGMGKTFITTKLAEDWANEEQLQQFKILLYITLGDFKGSLQQYVREELLPSYFRAEQFDNVWDYCKTHEKEVLFVLDGFDELEQRDKGEIQNLIRSKDFPRSKVVVTSRPNFLQEWEKKIFVNGFDHMRIMNFIEKYFKAIGNNVSGMSLYRIIEKDEKYCKLARRPLFCVLLCMLYITGEAQESLPERQSDVILQIILCLIKWNRKSNGTLSTDFETLPQEYQKPFLNFGKLCLKALRTEKSRFSQQEVHQVNGFESKLEQLGFLFNDNERHALGEKKFWKPIHQTFLEYFGAFYMARHIRECKSCKECKDYSQIFQRSWEVLKFCVGILNKKAHKVLDGERFTCLWKASTTKILQLLKEAESSPENNQAVAKLLDHSTVEITTSEIELEGWSIILKKSFKNLSTLRIVWRIESKSPDQERSFVEASEAQYQNFFDSLRENESIKSIHVRAKQDGESFSEEKIAMFFKYFQAVLFKKNLQELHIVEMKINASQQLKEMILKAAEQSSNQRSLGALKVLHLHTFMGDNDLKEICDCLRTSASSLETLHFEGLEHGYSGFKSLAALLKSSTSIKNLCLSMNQSLFVNAFGSSDEKPKNYDPKTMKEDHQKIPRTAGQKSKRAFSEREKSKSLQHEDNKEEDPLLDQNECSNDVGQICFTKVTNDSSFIETDPRRELDYLFSKLSLGNGHWQIEARRFWFLRNSSSDIHIPLPICIHREHKSVFHILFHEIPFTNLASITFIQAGLYLTIPDMVCLGHSIRKASHLCVLNLQGLDKAEYYLPLLIGLGQSSSLTTVNLSSSKIVFHDSPFEVVCVALNNNVSLRNLSLRSWKFKLQNPKHALTIWTQLLGCWKVTQLDLKNCSVDFGNTTNLLTNSESPWNHCSEPLTAFFSTPFENCSDVLRSISTLSLEGVELKEESGLVRRGHLLLPGLSKFCNLVSLDLSTSHSKPIQVDDISLRRFLGILGSEMKQLTDLKLNSWEFNLTSMDSELATRLHSCKKIKRIQLERVNELLPNFCSKTNESSWCKKTFLHQLISHIPNLGEISLCYYRINNCSFDSDFAAGISQCLHDHWHHTPFTVKFFNLSLESEDVIHQNLKKPPYKVKRISGPSLTRIFEVRNVLQLRKKY